MAQPRSRFPAYPPDLPEGLQLFLEAIRKEIESVGSAGAATIRVEESDVAVSIAANTLDFLGGDFNLTESPAGEVNISLNTPFSKAALPAAVAYEDEANTFTLQQTFSADVRIHDFFIEDRVSSTAWPVFRPANVNTYIEFGVMPRGTPASAFNAAIALWNTDFQADTLNYERLIVTAYDTEYLFANEAAGTGIVRPVRFSPGPLIVGTDPGGAETLRVGGSGRFGGVAIPIVEVISTSGPRLQLAATTGDAAIGTATNHQIRFFNNNLDRMLLTTAALTPATAGGLTLGTSALPWADLHMSTVLRFYSGTTKRAGFFASGAGVLAVLDETDTGTVIFGTAAVTPNTAGGRTLGTTTLPWGTGFFQTASGVVAKIAPDGLFTTSGWNKGLELSNVSVIKWTGNAGGKRFFIGQTTDALYMGRSTADDGTGPPGYVQFWHDDGHTETFFDLTIGSLGRFDSTDTPGLGETLFYTEQGGTQKWRAQTVDYVVGTGDFHAALLGDNTGVAYVLEVLAPADGAVNAPATPTVIAKHNSFELRIPSNYVKTANFKRFKWETCVGASCVSWSHLIYSTSLNIVHARLTTGEIRRYQVRAESTTTVSAFATTGDNTVTAGSDTEAFGGIVAGNIAAVDMAALTGDFGVMKVGQIRNLFTSPTSMINFGGKGTIPSSVVNLLNMGTESNPTTVLRLINFDNVTMPTWTDGESRAWVNLNSSASTYFLRHDKFQLRHDGSMFMKKIVVILTSGTSWTVPADFNPFMNSVELIGGGGGGDNGGANNGGGGGGGGGCRRILAFNPGTASSITYAIGTAGSADGGTGGITTWHSGAFVAGGGGPGSGIVGGAGGSGDFVGGAGGTGASAGSDRGAGGGGGAAGPHAAGTDGSNASGTTGGAGGSGAAPNGGAGGTAGGGAGGAGTIWTANPGGSMAGAGGGGGGGSGAGGTGGASGNYGAGGGGGGASLGVSAAGKQGIIVVTYFPIGAL